MKRPIILDNAINRIGDENKVFEYDYFKDMNVIKTKTISVPFIDSGNLAVELETKTKVKRESDDEAFSLLEICSKTEVERERDDEEISLAELVSKTFVGRERDDEDDNNYN